MADFADCLDTPEGTKAELEALETQLADEYRLPRALARALLLALDEMGKLEDSPLVADWRSTYFRFLDWAECENSWTDPPPQTKPKAEKRTEAATAASSLLCVAKAPVSTRLAVECPWTQDSSGPLSASSRA